MRAILIMGLGLGLFAGPVAWAQTGGPRHSGAGERVISASMDQPRSMLPTLGENRGFKPGMVVKDRQGVKVGIILRTDETRGAHRAFILDDNGARFTVRASRFRLNAAGDEAIVSLTRSQIRTAAILNAP